MNKNLAQLLNKLVTESENLKKFNEQENLNDLYEFSLTISDGYSMDEFKDFLNEIAKSCSSYQNGVEVISPSELDCVAGGISLLDSKKLKSLMLTGFLVGGGISGLETLSGANSVYAYPLGHNSSSNKNQSSDNTSKVTKTSIITPPTAGTIAYGQKLASSTLSGGVSNVAGTFDWIDPTAEPTVGEHTFWVKFTPNDSRLTKKTLQIRVKVKKATPYIITKPKAGVITYGDALYKSTLNNGKANVSGSFIWKNANKYLNAGSSQYNDVIFIPDDEENYERVSLRVPVDVKKAPSLIESYPYASSITYGQPLRASNVYNLTMNTPGAIAWASPDAKLSAGNHICSVIFTPFSNNYESKTIDVNVTVNKATPVLEKNSFTQSYKPNTVASDFKLPSGWRWQNPHMRLDGVGKFEINVVYDETNNYRYRSETVSIEITKAEPQAPSYDMVYDPNSRLRDIRLPVGWHWINENEVPINAKRYYKASFNAYEAGTSFYYSKDSVDVPINVRKAVPKVFDWAKQYTDIVFGTDLTTVPLSGGKSEVPGTFRLANSHEELRAGEHMCKVIFTPSNPNYSSVTGTIPIKISKNMMPLKAPEMPSAVRNDTSISFDTSKFGSEVEFSKDSGKSWQSSPAFSGLLPNTPYYFNIRYKENDSRCAGQASEAVKVLTKASSPSAPPAPVVKSCTRHKIVMENGDELEFSIDNGANWQSSPEFDDLKRNTEYSIISRIKETDDAMPSVRSEPTEVKTKRFPRPLSWLFG